MLEKFIPVFAIIFATAASDFIWPKELSHISEDQWHHVALADAPPNFNVEGLSNEEFIDQADAVIVDLRGDGHHQLIINNGGGGSAGRGWSIYDKLDGKWKLIGDGCGGLTLCQKYNGYYQIEVWSRGGGGNFTKGLLRFEKDRYHAARLEDWKIDADGNRKFIGARDPKTFDN